MQVLYKENMLVTKHWEWQPSYMLLRLSLSEPIANKAIELPPTNIEMVATFLVLNALSILSNCLDQTSVWVSSSYKSWAPHSPTLPVILFVINCFHWWVRFTWQTRQRSLTFRVWGYILNMLENTFLSLDIKPQWLVSWFSVAHNWSVCM